MANCLVAQSGGPTAVINASLAGVIRANQLNPLYDRVLGGLHGIEGTLAGSLFDLTDLSGREIEVLKQTPSCALGTCRYKFSDEADFRRLIDVMDENDISTMFYIGGNGSMSTVAAMTAWAAERNLDKRFIGIPKTVDNDLGLMDHCPGFASAAKVACEITHATRMDYDAYTRPEVFVLETMGRDAGWLAASTCLTGDVDLLGDSLGVLFGDSTEVVNLYASDAYMEMAKMEQQGSCYVVVSEGARWYDGTYLSANGKAADGLGHAMLGGAAGRLKSMIVEAGIVPRCVVQDLSRVARSSNFAMSLVDLEESYDLGVSAHMRSAKPEFTGQVVGIRRGRGVDGGYNTCPAADLANFVRPFPSEWILPNYQGVSDEALDYFRPLIQGEPKLICENGIPVTMRPFNRR